ncbi:hypothetical protein DY000_02033579 [Brassica cretica]|uniref:Uncharacterized protein n=1 Tax=Brassica cretica TaxID=69181 RepID=A0ABQ7DVC3_BRACR|nr:hypothetical protein DY000_02033579 [Brassica cretica]
MEFVSTLAPSSRTSTEEARGSSSPPDPTMSNKHGCSGRNLESDLHNQLLCRSQFPSLRFLLTSSDLFWEARNVKGGVELMGLDMLILDSKGDLICELTAVKSIVSDPTQGKHRVMTGGNYLIHIVVLLTFITRFKEKKTKRLTRSFSDFPSVSDVSLTLSLFHSQLSSSIISQAPGRLLC